MMKYLINGTLALLMIACSQPKKAAEEQTEEVVEEITREPALTKIWESDTTLLTPESVLFDEGNNVLYVSCINGVPPNAQDEDGYIAKVNPADGSIIEMEWVTGLDAPKGMGQVGNTLYVTNIDEVVAIDVTTGEITNRIAVEGAEFLNDITTDPEGNVYFSDSNTNKIHKLSATGELTTWIEGEELGGPNGLFFDGDKIMLATFGRGDLSAIALENPEVMLVADSIPGGDGVEKVGEDFLVSNWNGEVFYVYSDGDIAKMIDTKEAGANAADIEFIEKDMTVLVPTFFGNQVVAYKLSK